MVRDLIFLWSSLCHTAWLSFSVVVCITDPNYWCGCFFVLTDVATAPLICASDQCSRPRFVGLSGPDCTLSKPSRDMSRGWAHRLVTQSVGMSLRLPTKLYPQSDPMWKISLLAIPTAEIVQHKTLTVFTGLACRIGARSWLWTVVHVTLKATCRNLGGSVARLLTD